MSIVVMVVENGVSIFEEGRKKSPFFCNRLLLFPFSIIWVIVKTAQRSDLSEAAWLWAGDTK